MPRKVATRSEMIGSLVDHSVYAALSEDPQHWLKNIFENGFVGYGRFSNHQLMLEMQLRGLVSLENAIEDERSDESDEEILAIQDLE